MSVQAKHQHPDPSGSRGLLAVHHRHKEHGTVVNILNTHRSQIGIKATDRGLPQRTDPVRDD